MKTPTTEFVIVFGDFFFFLILSVKSNIFMLNDKKKY